MRELIVQQYELASADFPRTNVLRRLRVALDAASQTDLNKLAIEYVIHSLEGSADLDERVADLLATCRWLLDIGPHSSLKEAWRRDGDHLLTSHTAGQDEVTAVFASGWGLVYGLFSMNWNGRFVDAGLRRFGSEGWTHLALARECCKHAQIAAGRETSAAEPDEGRLAFQREALWQLKQLVLRETGHRVG